MRALWLSVYAGSNPVSRINLSFHGKRNVDERKKLHSRKQIHKMKRTGPTNEHLRKLIAELKKLSIEQNAAIWKRIALELERPTRQRRIVNISR
ncbi:unnamed protein product, partial [marine sediment metagenome]